MKRLVSHVAHYSHPPLVAVLKIRYSVDRTYLMPPHPVRQTMCIFVSGLNGAALSMPSIEASHAELSSVKGVATCAGVKMRGTAKLPHKHALVTLLA